MSAEFANHLWQSTVVALAAALLALALRGHEARVRYWIWFAASVKFLVPLSPLVALGSSLSWGPVATNVVTPVIARPIAQITQPFSGLDAAIAPSSPLPPAPVDWSMVTMLAVWACGAVAIAIVRVRMWRRIRAAVRVSVPWTASGVESPAGLEVRAAPGLMEPGVLGLVRPMILVPLAIERHLSDRQLDAVLVHERCHVERRDNLTATIHMLVEAIFWFHPLVWWIGARLLRERERACDEQVLRELGEPRIYAEAIVNVCKRYVEAPLACVSGVGGGAHLKARIEAIMANRIGLRMTLGKKIAVTVAAAAAVTLPILAGATSSALGTDEGQIVAPPAAAPAFEIVSLKREPETNHFDALERHLGRRLPWHGDRFSIGTGPAPGIAVRRLIQAAYSVAAFQVGGGPSWIDTDRYEIDLRMSTAVSRDKLQLVLQSLLAERFALELHRRPQVLQAYELVATADGPRLAVMPEGGCIPIEREKRPPTWSPTTPFCGLTLQILSRSPNRRDRIELIGMTMPTLVELLSDEIGGVIVDRTGFTSSFSARLEFPVDPTEPAAPRPSFLAAVEDQLGLRLEPALQQLEVLTIERIERPLEN